MPQIKALISLEVMGCNIDIKGLQKTRLRDKGEGIESGGGTSRVEDNFRIHGVRFAVKIFKSLYFTVFLPLIALISLYSGFYRHHFTVLLLITLISLHLSS